MIQKTVLVVDDEETVRMLLCQALQNCGHILLEAASGADAIALSRTTNLPIDFLVTDVMMPGMNGPELAKTLCAARPALKVILISGYSDIPTTLEQDWRFLQKPFLPSTLCDTLQQMSRPADAVTAAEGRR